MKKRVPCTKITYADDIHAWLRAIELFKKHGWDEQPYKCPMCEKWHLSSQKKRIPKWVLELIAADKDLYLKTPLNN